MSEIFDAKGAVEAGLIDKIVTEEELPFAGKMTGRAFSQLNMTAFYNTKLRSRKAIFALLDQAIEDDLDPEKVHAV